MFQNTESKITVLLDIMCSRHFVQSKHISSSGFEFENLPPSFTKLILYVTPQYGKENKKKEVLYIMRIGYVV